MSLSKKIPTTIKIILLNKIDGSSANKVALGSNIGEAENPFDDFLITEAPKL
jgi:hypothetical protein